MTRREQLSRSAVRVTATATRFDGTTAERGSAVFGPLTSAEARVLVAALRVGDDPDTSARDLPWAAVVRRNDGSVAATCATMLVSGLFWAVQGDRITIATDPGSVAQAVPAGAAGLDPEWLRDFVAVSCDPTTTPYRGVQRLLPGRTLVWRPGSTVSITEWCGAETLPTWPQQHVPDPRERYLSVFDRVVAELVLRAGPVVTTVSGGLDSTFLAASLVRASDRTVHGYCHTSVRAADVHGHDGADVDDWPFAQLLEQRYRDRLTLAPLRNDALVHPLDAAAARSAGGWPTFGAANAVWLNQYDETAARSGARLKFFGGMGNATFSHSHDYAAREFLRRGHVAGLARLTGVGRPWGETRRAAVSRRIVAPLRRPEPHVPAWVTAAAAPIAFTPAPPTRAAWLTMAAGHRSPMPAAWFPGADKVLVVDPFAARSVIELAAAIPPLQWQGGPAGHRGLARQLGNGRIPDEIRLRRRRGGQARDAWFVVRANPQRFDDALNTLGSSPALGSWVDVDGLARWWRRAREVPDTPRGLGVLLRLLATAEFEAGLD